MPRVSLVGAGHGGSEDYATLALWWTAESGTDYGSLIEAVCSGIVAVSNTMFSGATPHGYAVYAKSGEDFNGTNELTCPQAAGFDVISPNGSVSGIASIGTGSNQGMSQTGQDTLVEFCFLSHSGTGDAANQNSTNTNKIMRNCVIDGVGNFGFVANSNTFLNQVENCLVIGTSLWGILASNASVLIQNNFCFGHSTNDISSNTGVFITNATQDLTGNAGLTGFTSAELVNFAGGDYRTKSTSALATAGTGAQGFIGAFLEVSSGITVTEDTVNTNYTVLDPTITLTGTITVTEDTVNTSYTSLDPTITLTATITITEDTVNTNYTALNPTITLTPTDTIVITEETVNTNYTSLDPVIILSGTITITEDTVNTNYTALNPIINSQVIISSTFSGVLKEILFSGSIKETSGFTGTVKNININGILNKTSGFNGAIKSSTFKGVL